MKIHPCPVCGKEISPNLDACPYCGCPAAECPEGPRVGDFRYMGRWGDTDMEWQILKIEDGKALLLNRFGIAPHKYHDTCTDITWADCDLRAWLNGEFLTRAFSDYERSRIQKVLIPNHDNPKYDIPGGPATEDFVFCLSMADTDRYFMNYTDLICVGTTFARNTGLWTAAHDTCAWWLRTPGSGASRAMVVTVDGEPNKGGRSVNYEYVGVRPAMWVEL